MTAPTVLVVEDDPAIRRGIVDALEYAGYGALEAEDGERGLALALEMPIDLVLLDVMLPKRSGFDLLTELRRARATLPVIMVTARGDESDRVHGLRSGADDYVVKPFSAVELLARVEAVMRRSPERNGDVRRLSRGSEAVDLHRREVTGTDRAQTLTERECDILRYLAVHRGRAVDRRELLHHVWGLDPRGLETRTVDMQVARLREKLGANGPDGTGAWIVTVRGKGYELGGSVEIET